MYRGVSKAKQTQNSQGKSTSLLFRIGDLERLHTGLENKFENVDELTWFFKVSIYKKKSRLSTCAFHIKLNCANLDLKRQFVNPHNCTIYMI